MSATDTTTTRRRIFEDEHEDFRQSVRRWLTNEVAPRFDDWERDGIVPREVFAAAGANGFIATQVPEEFGGAGVDDFRFNVVLSEECFRLNLGGFGVGLTLHNDVCLPYFLEYCNDEQKQRWLPGITDGTLITAIAMTEPGTGSDLAGIKTKAVRDGDHYVVNGAKTFITNGINSELIVTAVKTDPTQRHKGISVLVIEGDTRASSAAATSRRSACTPRTPPSCSSTTRACRSRTCSAPRARLRPDGPQPRAGAPQRRGRRRRHRAGGDPDDRRVRPGARGVRLADLLVPEHALRARRVQDRGRRRAGVRRRGHAGARRGDAVGRARRRGQAVRHRGAGPRHRPLRPALRRLRLHARVPDRAPLRRRARQPDLRRHERDHEGDRRPLAGAG